MQIDFKIPLMHSLATQAHHSYRKKLLKGRAKVVVNDSIQAVMICFYLVANLMFYYKTDQSYSSKILMLVMCWWALFLPLNRSNR
jgi:hypothetical protein